MMNRSSNKKNRPIKLPVNSRAPGSAHYDEKIINEPDAYCLKLSHTMRICKYVSAGLLVIFILIMVLAYSNTVNAENASRLLSSLKIELNSNSPYSNGNVSFSADGYFGTYRSYPVAFSNGELTFFSRGGTVARAFDISGDIKQTLFSDKAVLLVSEYTIQAYNSYSVLFEKEFDEPIYDVYLCENGHFAVLTKEVGYRSAVYVYNNGSDALYRWRSADKTVLDMHLSDVGILTLTVVENNNGAYLTSTIFTDIAFGDSHAVSHGDATVLMTAVFDSASWCTVSTGSVRFYNSDLEMVSQINQNGNILYCDNDGERICFITDSLSLCVADRLGNILSAVSISHLPEELLIVDGSIYLLYPDRLDILSDEGIFSSYLIDQPLAVVVPSDGKSAIFTKNNITSFNNIGR